MCAQCLLQLSLLQKKLTEQDQIPVLAGSPRKIPTVVREPFTDMSSKEDSIISAEKN